MMEILSTSQPSVSATAVVHGASHERAKLLVDALDEIVAALIELVDVALRGRDLMIVVHARFVLLVPQLDVRLCQAGHEVADRLIGHASSSGWRESVRQALGLESSAACEHEIERRQNRSYRQRFECRSL